VSREENVRERVEELLDLIEDLVDDAEFVKQKALVLLEFLEDDKKGGLK